ncbi:MAG: DUF2461 family protein [Paraglaciecola sp.]|uniref:DUF2461 family protein n=1 Tax=Paraglaciecola sp. TaxID=1920173 RepID=UPI00273DCB1B|nr:DUF2461 family protein [Paraglaciecola sp.]MDP5031751.1 DUF2461 family protein [Paraglaciecola sp.]MDP5134194.1 DUF2461 family protein [Paraglaciecola sp.]
MESEKRGLATLPLRCSFLRQRQANNNGEWFTSHKQEYEDKVRPRALEYIETIEPWSRMFHHTTTPLQK